MNPFDVLLSASVIVNGILAGVFFAFACAVSPALSRLDDRTYVEAFRSINTVILNVWFFAAFVLAPAMTITVAVSEGVGRSPAAPWAVIGAVCSVSTVVVTAAANVPMNRALDTAPTSTELQYGSARTAFEANWNRWNLTRTLTSVGATMCLACAG